MPLKTVCSASFLIIFLINEAFEPEGDMLIWPLIACYIGDVMMGLYNTYSRKKYIFLGIGAFLLAHMGFLNYMMDAEKRTSLLVWSIPILMILMMLLIYKKLHLHMGRVVVPGLIYCYFVSAMCAKALTMGGATAVAGLLFFMSDFSILFLYFYHFKSGAAKRWVHWFNLVTYYGAIMVFVITPLSQLR